MLFRKNPGVGAVLQSLIFSLALTSCGDEAKNSLDLTLQEDLQFMTAEMIKGKGKDNLRAQPYYVIEDYRKVPTDSSMETDVKARVRFYYLKNTLLCQERTYHHPRMGTG